MRWTREDLDKLKELDRKGLSIKGIAKQFRRPWRTVLARLYYARKTNGKIKKSKCSELTSSNAAYIAGVIDGEGCIMLQKRKEGTKYSPILTVSNTYFPLIEFLKKTTGVGGTLRILLKEENRKPQLRWTITGRDTIALLKQTIRYMRVKHVQAKCVIEAYEKYLARGGFYLTKSDCEKLNRLVKRIKKSNQRGITCIV